MKGKRWNWNKSQRMQMKAFICVLGLLLLLLLLVGRILIAIMHRGEPEPEPEVHIPVIEELANVWVMEVAGDSLLVFMEGGEKSFPYGEDFRPDASMREQVADIELTDGQVTKVVARTDKINGRILSADESGVEVEGYGRLPLAADYKGYRIYNSLAMCTYSDLVFGYDFADLVMENNEICGILLVREEAMENIRVLIKASNYEGLFHEQLTFTANTGFTIQYGPYDSLITEQHAPGEEVTVEPGSPYLEYDRMTIVPDVLTGRIILKNVNRSQGTPSYRGHMELEKTEQGIVAVNELPLEEYLYCVVPSEMPASYPAQALMAQAVCARTYAYGHMQKAGYPQYGAHVDDSTSYQVYNNILEQESTTTAVKESFGQLLYTAGGKLAGTYYYSTSCGMGTDANIWKTEEAATLTYLQAKPISIPAVEAQNALKEQNAVEAQNAVEGQNAAERQNVTEAQNISERQNATERQNASEGQNAVEGQNTMQAQNAAEGQNAVEGQNASEAQNTSQAQQAGTLAETEYGRLGEELRDEENFAAFIQSKNADDFEVSEGWYRWSCQVKKLDTEHLHENLQKRYDANNKQVLTLEKGEYVSKPIKTFKTVKDIYVEKRGAGGVVDELIIETDSGTYKVVSEHSIRYALNDGNSKVMRQDGKAVDSPSLLPSGFFIITLSREKDKVTGYTITGGGFGHGVGMSQNGARDMAEQGLTSDAILGFFFEGCEVRNIYQ